MGIDGKKIVSSYYGNVKDVADITIAVLCSHSALPTAAAAKAAGFRTLGITTEGREETYALYNKRLFDDLEYVDAFKSGVTIIDEKIQQKIVKNNGIIIPNRSLSAYCGFDFVEIINVRESPSPIFRSIFNPARSFASLYTVTPYSVLYFNDVAGLNSIMVKFPFQWNVPLTSLP